MKQLQRTWHERTGLLLIGYLLLGIAADWILTRHGHPILPRNIKPIPWPLAPFFAWRVTCGGWISRWILIAGSAVNYSVAAIWLVGPSRGLAILIVLAAGAQLTILVSPAVCARVDSPSGKLPAELLTLGPLAGLCLTVVSLAHLTFSPGPSGGMDAGEPLSWLTTSQPVHTDWTAMAKDWLAYSVLSCGILALLWATWFGDSRPRITGISALAGLAITTFTLGWPWPWVSSSGFDQPALAADWALWTAIAAVIRWSPVIRQRWREQHLHSPA
jgi:hypothetical protein